ncbi:MAG TPA: hypothetical protein VHX42_01545 [Candidatus Babeliales bacterium]|jgi:hypothetical protein|nr:hypothetical protein [Candidatus Babeliales bacterium]
MKKYIVFHFCMMQSIIIVGMDIDIRKERMARVKMETTRKLFRKQTIIEEAIENNTQSDDVMSLERSKSLSESLSGSVSGSYFIVDLVGSPPKRASSNEFLLNLSVQDQK